MIMEENLSLDTAIKNHVLRVLELCKGNKTQASKILSVDRKTLQRWFKLWNIG